MPAEGLLAQPGETPVEHVERMLAQLVRTQREGGGLVRWLPVTLTAIIAVAGALAAYFATANEARNATAAAERAEKASAAAILKLETELGRRVEEAKARADAAVVSAQEAKDMARDRGDQQAAQMGDMQVTLTRVDTMMLQLVKSGDETRAQLQAILAQDRTPPK